MPPVFGAATSSVGLLSATTSVPASIPIIPALLAAESWSSPQRRFDRRRHAEEQRRMSSPEFAPVGSLNKQCRRHMNRETRKRHRRRTSLHFSQFPGTHRTGQLFCRTGFYLQVHDAKINGTRSDQSPYGILEFIAVAAGLVSIRGMATKNWLCMNSDGRLYSSKDRNISECVFLEEMQRNWYNTYASCGYTHRRRRPKRWYVALSKRGRPRRGRRTYRKRKYAQFLVIPTTKAQNQQLLAADRRRWPSEGSGRFEWRNGVTIGPGLYNSRFGSQDYAAGLRIPLDKEFQKLVSQGKIRLPDEQQQRRPRKRKKSSKKRKRRKKLSTSTDPLLVGGSW